MAKDQRNEQKTLASQLLIISMLDKFYNVVIESKN